MPLAIAFWVVYLIWIILGAVTIWHSGGYLFVGSNIILLLLLGIVGWQLFGAPIHR